MSLHKNKLTARRRTGSRPLTLTLAALGALVAAATVQAENQTNPPPPPVRRPPVTAHPVPQPVAPQQRPGVNIPQTAPNAANTNQLRNLLNRLGPRNTNASAPTAPQVRTPVPNTNGSAVPQLRTPIPSVNNRAVTQPQLRTPIPSFNNRAVTQPQLRTPNVMGSRGLPTNEMARTPQRTTPFASRSIGGQLPSRGIQETRMANGAIVRKAADGSVMEVANPRNGMLIQHGADGSRRVLVNRPDHTRIFASSRGVQYVQHPYSYGGRAYDHRTYYFQGRTEHRYYRPYTYGSTTLDAYAPTRFYPITFYRWALTPFRPTAFQWGYTNQPWYQHYSGYFTPETSYSTPSAWLADYVIGTSLLTAYNAAQQGQQPPPPPDATSAITPDVKQMVALEAQRQVRQETVEAQENASRVNPPPGNGGVVAELSDHQTHAFVVGSDLDLVDDSGRRCMVSEGDVVAVVAPATADGGTADAIVLASKGGSECQRSVRVQVALNDVQEMQNHMRETVDEGLASTNAAKGVTTVTPAFAQAGPPADPNAAQEIEQQQQIAAAAGEG